MRRDDQMAIWVFDSHCVLCDAGVRYTLKHEHSASIRFVAIKSTEGRALAAKHGIDADDPTSFLFIDAGIALQSSDAVIALARHLTGPARLVPLFRIIPKAVRDFAYQLIARNRFKIFGRTSECILPTPDTRHRFTL